MALSSGAFRGRRHLGTPGGCGRLSKAAWFCIGLDWLDSGRLELYKGVAAIGILSLFVLCIIIFI